MIRTIAAFAVAAAMLTGCSEDEPRFPPPPPPDPDFTLDPNYKYTPSTPEPTPPDPEDVDPGGTNPPSQAELGELGLVLLRNQEPRFEDVPDQLIDNQANAICNGLDLGSGFDAVAVASLGNGLTAAEVGAVMGYAVFVKCSEHKAEFDAWVRQVIAHWGPVSFVAN